MTEVKVKIDGMSCMHCVGRVKQALSGLAGVADANVEVGSASVKFDETKLKKEDIETAVKKAGYKVTAIS